MKIPPKQLVEQNALDWIKVQTIFAIIFTQCLKFFQFGLVWSQSAQALFLAVLSFWTRFPGLNFNQAYWKRSHLSFWNIVLLKYIVMPSVTWVWTCFKLIFLVTTDFDPLFVCHFLKPFLIYIFNWLMPILKSRSYFFRFFVVNFSPLMKFLTYAWISSRIRT